MKFLKENGLMIFFAIAALATLGYLVYAYFAGVYPWGSGPVIPLHSGMKAKRGGSDMSQDPSAHLSVTADDFSYLDLSKSVVVPVTNPTNDVQEFTKHVDENGMVTWEPKVMMDPIDILGREQFDAAVNGYTPGVSAEQLKRLTTPSVLLHNGGVFWGFPSLGGAPAGPNRYCIQESDIPFNGVFSDNSSKGTWDNKGFCGDF